MDEFDRTYSIKSVFNEHLLSRNLEQNHENISEEFARYFSIDDDIVLLDQSEILFNEVKIVLNELLNKIQDREHNRSQILNFLRKHSLDFNNEEDCPLNKKVRFNIPDDKQQQQQSPSTHLFVSEKLQSINPSAKPYTQFLSNLGFDLCLEQNLDETNHHLSETDKQTLIKHNQIFHQYPIHSCKYCSFQTNTIHVMDYHYRTPHVYHHDKYRCTYCSFRTFRLSELRRHAHRKHHYSLISEPSIRRYQCVYCSYETDEKNHFFKHNKRCQIEQTRTCMANNLLAPSDHEQFNRNINTSITTMKTKTIAKNNKNQTTIIPPTKNNEIFEPILIESDHDSSSLSRSSLSDEDFIVSSDEESSLNTDNENINHKDFEILTSRSKPAQQFISKPTKSIAVHPIPIVQPTTTLPSLSKLLLLNGSSIPSFTPSPYNSNKTPLIHIQPKPTSGTDVYQMCNICQCYIFKNDYAKHMNEKHHNPSFQSQQTISTPIIILNTPATTNPITCLKPTLILSKDTPQSPATIFLLSTSNMNTQLISLNMIKCPWCDTNFEHIDIMTGHLMRYHRMTLAAAKVVVAEQMKIQGTSSNELSHMFKLEIEQIQKEFADKIYWKISQPKVYLHQIENFSCFVCHVNVDDIENHFLTSHQIQLAMMNNIKQCCLCGFHCNVKNSSLFEHQLRTHAGVCYSSILKQFIRFEPPPPPLSRTIPITKNNNRLILTSHQRALTTHTDKKFGCRKCATSSGLFTFEELVEHLRIKHEVNVKLHRRCIICQQTYLKGNEYNRHCLEHLNDENPSIKLQRKSKI